MLATISAYHGAMVIVSVFPDHPERFFPVLILLPAESFWLAAKTEWESRYLFIRLL